MISLKKLFEWALREQKDKEELLKVLGQQSPQKVSSDLRTFLRGKGPDSLGINTQMFNALDSFSQDPPYAGTTKGKDQLNQIRQALSQSGTQQQSTPPTAGEHPGTKPYESMLFTPEEVDIIIEVLDHIDEDDILFHIVGGRQVDPAGDETKKEWDQIQSTLALMKKHKGKSVPMDYEEDDAILPEDDLITIQTVLRIAFDEGFPSNIDANLISKLINKINEAY